jgi:hypothetical protein
MNRIPLFASLVGALASCGCFQMDTRLKVNGDGSGTIDQRLLFTASAINQFRGLSGLSGGNGGTFDPISEEQARAAAATLGPGVTYVSSTRVAIGGAEGRDMTYAFEDINQLRLSPIAAFGGGRARAQTLAGSEPVSFVFARQPSGTAVLRIRVPRPPMPNGDALGPSARSQLSLDQMEIFKQMLAGARISLSVEPSGPIVRTTSPFVDGRHITLVDVSLDRLLDDAVMARLQRARTEEDAKAALAGVDGVKVTFDPETTIEFAATP